MVKGENNNNNNNKRYWILLEFYKIKIFFNLEYIYFIMDFGLAYLYVLIYREIRIMSMKWG